MKKAGRMLKPVVSLAIAAATVLTMALCLPFNTLDTEAAKKITEADINAVRDRIKANEKNTIDIGGQFSHASVACHSGDEGYMGMFQFAPNENKETVIEM